MTNLAAHPLDIVHWFLTRKRPRRSRASAAAFAWRTTARRPTRRTRSSSIPASRPSGRTGRRAPARRRWARSSADPKAACRSHGAASLWWAIARFPRTTPCRSSPGRTRSADRSARSRPGRSKRGPSRSKTNRAMPGSNSSCTLRNFLDCVKSRKQPISDLESAPSRGHGLPSGQHFAAAGPAHALGREAGRDHRRCGGNADAGQTLSGAVGSRTTRPKSGVSRCCGHAGSGSPPGRGPCWGRSRGRHWP